jgi:hypothetical protein
MDKVWYVNPTDYLAIKIYEIMDFAGNWMELEVIM